MRGLAIVLVLGACSETGLSEITPPPDEGGDEAPAGGGFGDWSLGDVPDLYVVMAVYGGSWERASEVLVVDLRGQVLDRWAPPPGANGLADTFVREVRSAGPGAVLVTTDTSFGWGTRLDAPPGQRPTVERGPASEVWHGDLVDGTWTRVLRADPELDAPVVEATGRGLAPGWASDRIGRYLPLGDDVLVTGTPIDCASASTTTWTRLSLDATVEDAVLDPGVEGASSLWRVRGGASEERWVVGSVARPCADPVLHLDTWVPGESAEALGELPYDATLSGLRWHGASSTALATAVSYAEDGSPEAAEARWVTDAGVAVEPLPEAAYVQPVAVLDPPRRAFAYTAWNSEARRDELVIRAGGEEVWRIDAVRDGLTRRDLQVFDAIVVGPP